MMEPGRWHRIDRSDRLGAVATTVRCPACGRKNQVPAGAEAKARCGACQAPLRPARSRALDVTDPTSVARPGGAGGPGGLGGPGSPWGSGGPPGPASPWGLGGPGGGPGGASAPWAGGGDPSGARMRQARRTPRRPSTGASRLGDPSAPPSDPRARLLQRWDELLRLAPPDIGLTAALGDGAEGAANDPISWLSLSAGIPRAELEEVRQVRNSLASNRPVPDGTLARALTTVDRALAVVGRFRLPE